MGRISCLALFIFVIFLGSLSKAIAELEYRIAGRLQVSVSLDIHSRKTIVRIGGLLLKSPESELKIITYKNGLLYHSKNESVYAEGFSEKEFEKEILDSKFSKSKFVWNILVNQTQAKEGCAITSNQIDQFSEVNQNIKLADFTKIIGQCDFSISKIIEEQIRSITSLASSVVSGSIWSQISDAVKAIRDVIPQIYDKLILPIGEILKQAPAIAQSLICSFTQNKVGQLALAALTGGGGIPMALSRTAVEVTELLNKVSVLQKNKKAFELVKKIGQQGQLNEATVNRILKMEHDLPEAHKGLNVKFRASENLEKHFESHKSEFGFKTSEEYERAAQNFVKSPGNANTAVYPLPNGDFNKINLATGEMVVTNKYGNIITYFKLACKNESEKLLFFLYSKEASQMGICRDR